MNKLALFALPSCENMSCISGSNPFAANSLAVILFQPLHVLLAAVLGGRAGGRGAAAAPARHEGHRRRHGRRHAPRPRRPRARPGRAHRRQQKQVTQ